MRQALSEQLIHRHIGGLEKNVILSPFAAPIHRHTGGLEKSGDTTSTLNDIHRHTGGLEKYVQLVSLNKDIHRHTGGLETNVWHGILLYFNSPPHRRLRKMQWIFY